MLERDMSNAASWRRRLSVAVAVGVLTTMLPGEGRAADLITFETTPANGTPVDDSNLADPYTYSTGTVRFFFDADGNNAFNSATDVLPVFEATGEDTVNAFMNTVTGVADTARPGFESTLGQRFLRQPGGNGVNVPGPFIADYDSTTAIRQLSGEIWDIDGAAAGTEQWRVDVLSTAGAVLATQTSPLGIDTSASSLDGLPWTFQFTNLPDGVDKVRLTFIGSKTSGVGLAFNNFSPATSVPEPTTVATLAAVLGLATRRRAKPNA